MNDLQHVPVPDSKQPWKQSLMKAFPLITLFVVMALSICFATSIFRRDTARYDEHRPSDDARSIVAVWHAARKCGVHFGEPGDSLEDVMRKVGKGAPVTDPGSPFYGKAFTSGTLSDDALTEAAKYVRMKDGALILVKSQSEP